MSILTTRLKKIEKRVNATYADDKLEKELSKWLDAYPYKLGNCFHNWCDMMPKHLTKAFANHVKKTIYFCTLMDGFKNSNA